MALHCAGSGATLDSDSSFDIMQARAFYKQQYKSEKTAVVAYANIHAI